MQKVYIEFVFLDNFMINLLIVLFASRFTKAKVKWARFVCSAAVGGVYACVVFGAEGIAVSAGVKVAVSLLMCAVAYYTRHEKGFLKNTCAFYVTSFVFAGAIYACMFCFGEPATFGGALVVPLLLRAMLFG
ncbi:MAG: sigma-E processing peptidase SpoIIGA, partial [Eubacteriales bacterium]|nr:sigma-E processing peptidase SpoIIGA [Eubacteriales bacterium]